MFTTNGPALFLDKHSLLGAVKSFISGYLLAFPGWHSVDDILNYVNPVVSPILVPICPSAWSVRLLVAAACGDLARNHSGVLQRRVGKNYQYRL